MCVTVCQNHHLSYEVMAKNVIYEVTVTFDYQTVISSSLDVRVNFEDIPSRHS